jgi:hypothetical protein
MSLTGNIYFGGQNLENSHPLDNLNIDIDNLLSDILQNTQDIETNRTDIDNLQTDVLLNTADIEINTTDITTNTSNIASNLVKINSNTGLINTNINNISSNLVKINSNTNTNITHDTRLTNIETVNTTQNTRLTDAELKTRHQSSSYNRTSFDYTVQAVDVFAVNDPTYGNCSILRNRILISDIQTINNTQTTNISTNASSITAIQTVNATQTTNIATNASSITVLQDKTQALTYDPNGATFSVFSSQIWGTGNIFCTTDDYGLISMVTNRVKILENASSITVLQDKTRHQSSLADRTVFDFWVMATNCYSTGSRYGDISIVSNKNDISAIQSLNNAQNTRLTNIETLNTTQNTNISTNATNISTNVTNISTNATNISTNSTNISALDTRVTTVENNLSKTTNVLLVDDFLNTVSLTAGVVGTSVLEWKNYSSVGNSSTKMFTDVSQLGHAGIIQLSLPSTPSFANYQVHCGLNNMICWGDFSSTQIIFKIPTGLSSTNFKVVVGISNSNALTKSAVWSSTNNGYFKATVNNGAVLKTSTKFNFNVGNWIMSTTTRTATGFIMELTQPNNDVPSSKDTYTYTGTGILDTDLISPWIAIYEITGNLYPKFLYLDYISINLKPLRNNT